MSALDLPLEGYGPVDEHGQQAIYNQTLYIEDGNSSLHITIRRRIEGSCALHAWGNYGGKLPDDQLYRNMALDYIDELKGIAHKHRPYRKIGFKHTEEIRPVRTAAEAHAVVVAFIKQRGDVQDTIHSCSIHVNEHRLRTGESMNFSKRPRVNTVQYTRGTIPGGDLTSYEQPYTGSTLVQAHDAIWRLLADVLAGQAESFRQDADEVYGWMPRFTTEQSARMAEIDKQHAEITEEQKRQRQIDAARWHLSDLQNTGAANVRQLLEADPHFAKEEIDLLMHEIARSGEKWRGVIGAVAGEISKAIKPINEDETDDNPPPS